MTARERRLSRRLAAIRRGDRVVHQTGGGRAHPRRLLSRDGQAVRLVLLHERPPVSCCWQDDVGSIVAVIPEVR